MKFITKETRSTYSWYRFVFVTNDGNDPEMKYFMAESREQANKMALDWARANQFDGYSEWRA